MINAYMTVKKKNEKKVYVIVMRQVSHVNHIRQ